MPKNSTISGFVKPGFEAVWEAFSENFKRGKELGAACCIYYRGEKVVDLWDFEFEVTIIMIPQLDIAACKKVAQDLGVPLRIRPYRMSIAILAKQLFASIP